MAPKTILVAKEGFDWIWCEHALTVGYRASLTEIVQIIGRAKRADRMKMIWWDGTGLVMAYKRLEQNAFKWPAIKDDVLRLDPAQFEALFAGLDWRRVTALETRPPAAAE